MQDSHCPIKDGEGRNHRVMSCTNCCSRLLLVDIEIREVFEDGPNKRPGDGGRVGGGAWRYLEYGGTQAVDGSLRMAVKCSVPMWLSLLHMTATNHFLGCLFHYNMPKYVSPSRYWELPSKQLENSVKLLFQ